jgi:hypothetical protein
MKREDFYIRIRKTCSSTFQKGCAVALSVVLFLQGVTVNYFFRRKTL